MNLQERSIMALICALTIGCAAIPPSSQRVSYHSLLDRDPGVLLFVDVCIQKDAVGDKQDYFIVAESRAGAKALLETSHKFLADSGVVVSIELIPFVCGARHDTGAQVQKVADNIDGIASEAFQPFDVSEELRPDPDYINALGKASTYMFENALMPDGKANTVNSRQSNQQPQYLVSDEEFKAAVAIIAAKTQASSVLYLGVAGTSITSGKAVAGAVGRFFVGMATGIATAGLGTGYYAMFMPGGQIDGRLMGAALVDLQTGQLAWSNAVRAGDDPAKPEVVADGKALTLLLRSLMYQPVPTSSNQ